MHEKLHKKVIIFAINYFFTGSNYKFLKGGFWGAEGILAICNRYITMDYMKINKNNLHSSLMDVSDIVLTMANGYICALSYMYYYFMMCV